MSLARIECHYFVNQGFLRPNQILEDMPAIAHLPAVLVHGRYDCICPIQQAHLLHAAWPGSELHIIGDAGHSVTEPGIHQALQHALREMPGRLA